MNKRVLSGIRATGRLHLGNYFGAVKGMLELSQNKSYETFYMVADVHTITTPYKIEELRKNRREVILDYLAAGLDPKKSTLFIQSMVPEQIEMSFYFSSVITVARMLHLPTYKDKIKQHPDHATMALLNYPVLMAADILAYKSTDVPVGVDQEPHLEVARQIARSLNSDYGTDFPEPKMFATKGMYVPSLSGEGKMSKSVEGSYISLTDDFETIKSRIAKIPTDSGKGLSLAGSISSLLTFVELFEGEDRKMYYEDLYTSTGIKYSELKKSLAESIYETLKPIQEKRAELAGDSDYLEDVILEGAKKARLVAAKTLDEVKSKMGF